MVDTGQVTVAGQRGMEGKLERVAMGKDGVVGLGQGRGQRGGAPPWYDTARYDTARHGTHRGRDAAVAAGAAAGQCAALGGLDVVPNLSRKLWIKARWARRVGVMDGVKAAGRPPRSVRMDG